MNRAGSPRNTLVANAVTCPTPGCVRATSLDAAAQQRPSTARRADRLGHLIAYTTPATHCDDERVRWKRQRREHCLAVLRSTASGPVAGAIACSAFCMRLRIRTPGCRPRSNARRSRSSVAGIQITGKRSSTSSVSRRCAWRRSCFGRRVSALRTRPMTHPARDPQFFPSVAGTIRSSRWLRCPPQPALGSTRRTLVPSPFVFQRFLDDLSCLAIQHGNRLLRSVQIATYHFHLGLLRPGAI
jgi:hypothetical protein